MPSKEIREKMSKITDSARGRECQIRIAGVCNHNPETVVLCHLPGGGMGMKRHDFMAAYGCAACHDAVDGRVKTDEPTWLIRLWFYEAVFRTQQILLDEGLIKINGR